MSIDLTNVTASKTTGVAPLAIRFDAHLATSTSVSNPFHFIDFSWNFGDTGAGNWSYGAVTSKNIASGPIAAHVFETAGSYTVTLTAFDGASTASKTFSITVTDPNTVFATTSTVCCDPSNTFTGAPAGATLSTLSNLDTILSTYAASSKRILLARGQTFTTSVSDATIGAGPGIIGAFGSGAKPIIRTQTAGANVFRPASDWRIMDLTFDGATNSAPVVAFYPGNGTVNSILALRLTSASWNGLHSYTQASTPPTASNVFLVDCDFQAVRGAAYGGPDYLVWAFGIDGFCIMGTRLIDSTLAQHVCRQQFIRYSVASNCYLSTPLDGKSVFLWHGPNFVTDSGGGLTTQFNVITDCWIDSGDSATTVSPISITPQSVSTNEHVSDCIVDSCYIRSGNNTSGAGSALFATKITYRNNIFLFKNTTNDNICIDLDITTTTTPTPDSIWVINNSIKHVAVGVPSHIFRCNTVLPTNVYLYNNLRFAPSPSNSTDTAGFTAAADANNSGNAGMSAVTVDPLWANAGGSFALWSDFLLQSSSYARAVGTTSATDTPARYDAYHNAFQTTARDIGRFIYGSIVSSGGSITVRGGKRLERF